MSKAGRNMPREIVSRMGVKDSGARKALNDDPRKTPTAKRSAPMPPMGIGKYRG